MSGDRAKQVRDMPFEQQHADRDRWHVVRTGMSGENASEMMVSSRRLAPFAIGSAVWRLENAADRVRRGFNVWSNANVPAQVA